MGYRTAISYINKSEYNEIKGFNKEQFIEKYGKQINGVDDIDEALGFITSSDFLTEIYNFGKYTDFDEQNLSRFFLDDEINKRFHNSDTTLLLANKEFFKGIIEHYTQLVKKYYDDMLEPLYDGFRPKTEFQKTAKREYDKNYNEVYIGDGSKITENESSAIIKCLKHIQSMSFEWGVSSLDILPYNLERGKSVTTSWKYEYAIFELVRLYKYFDWEHNVLVYSGS